MGRRKLTLTADQREERRERERQRSKSRRRQQQPQTVAEAASDPTIRILQVYGEEEIACASDTPQHIAHNGDLTLGGTSPQRHSTADATLDTGEEVPGHELHHTSDRHGSQKSVRTEIKVNKSVRRPERSVDDRQTSAPLSERDTLGRRYNLREKTGATPPPHVTHRTEDPPENNSESIRPTIPISLPIRPVQVTSTEARYESVARRSPSRPSTKPDPPDSHDEPTTGEASVVDNTLVRSVIVVSTDDPDSLGEIEYSVTHDERGYDAASPGHADECGVEVAEQDHHASLVPDISLRDESDLFVSDESWDLDVEADALYASASCEQSPPSPRPVRHDAASTTVTPSPTTRPPLHEIVAAIESAESTAGRTFLSRQAEAYKKIFHEALSPGCACQESNPEPPDVDQDCFSMQEMTRWFLDTLGPVQELLAPTRERDTQHAERTEGRQWQALLAQPPASLSLAKSECDTNMHDVSITRAWDVDSIWLGAKSLAAIRPDNNSFRLSFHPPYLRSIAGNQIIQPHGLDLGHTRHTLLGSFVAGGVPMDVFVFFPNTNDGKPVKPRRARQQRAAKSPYTLSHERQQDLVNGAILPAVQSSLPALFRQEMPSTFAIAHAKSHSYQEKPATDRWSADDSARAAHLRYTLPGSYLGAFWQAFQARCGQIRIPVLHGTSEFAYFQNPKLLFQVHDTKNKFAQPTLGQSLDLFVREVMQALDPAWLDFRSCWLDIGFRDLAVAFTAEGRKEIPVTLLWKRKCLEKFHADIQDISPHMGVQSEYFRTYHLRDAATYDGKVRSVATRVPRPSDPGHPSCQTLGVVHAKAYDCDKERFSVITSDYRPFAAPSLAALAMTDPMMQDVFAAGHDHASAATGAPQRRRLETAWEANKRHLHAVVEHEAPTNGYAARKEITFRLDVILTMLYHGEFSCREPSEGLDGQARCGAAPASLGDSEHHPFWVVPTADVNSFVCTLACRFVKPLDSMFTIGAAKDEATSLDQHGARSLVYFYTAELFLRLLVSSLTSDRDYFADKWIWEKQWQPKQIHEGRRIQYTRCGLGLRDMIRDHGLLWFTSNQLDWMHCHLSIPTLLQLYIPRNPQHPQWAAQSSVRAFASSNASAAYVLEDLVLKAAHIRQHDQASLHLAATNERTAIHIVAQEVAREYGLHMLSKLLLYWRKAFGERDRVRQKYPNGPNALVAALEAIQLPSGRMVTPHTILDIMDEAWEIRPHADEFDEAEGLPAGLPYWMAKRAPKEQVWTRVVFNTLFAPPTEVTWAGNAFRVLYQRLRDLYNTTRHPDAVPFCDVFRDTVGRYITVMFNPDRTKEMNVSHGVNYCYRDLPPFFRIQFWAPFINPFRYRADTFEVQQPAFPLSTKWKRSHQLLQDRNADLLQCFRAVRALSITTTWVARQPLDTVVRLAGDLQKCVTALLRLTGPRHLPLASGQTSCYWNFQDPQSVDLQLWEIPVEGGSALGGVMPTVILPTLPVLRFLRRASRAAVRAMPLLTGPSSTHAVHELNRLQYWVDAIDQLFMDPSAKQGLISIKLGLLEEMKSLHGDSGDDGLLFAFLDQKDAPQTYRYLDDRDVPYADENEDGNEVTMESLAPDEDSESSDGRL